MNFCRIPTIITIIAALLVPAVAAQETGSHDYIVTPVEDMISEENLPFTPMSTGSIKQGETN